MIAPEEGAFEFRGPVVGPLTRDEFIAAVVGFDVYAAFPDLAGNMHDFRACPITPGRVWVTTQIAGTNTGDSMLGSATGTRVVTPPQAVSVVFDERGKIVRFNIGYPMDRTVGTTGGLGGIFGLLYGIGKGLPFPEAQPWTMSKRYRLFNIVGGVLRKLRK